MSGWKVEFTLTFTPVVLKCVRGSFQADILNWVSPGWLLKGEVWKWWQRDISELLHSWQVHYYPQSHRTFLLDKHTGNLTAYEYLPKNNWNAFTRPKNKSSLGGLSFILSSASDTHRKPHYICLQQELNKFSPVTERGHGSPTVTFTSPLPVLHTCVHTGSSAHILEHFSLLYHALHPSRTPRDTAWILCSAH